MTSVTSGWNRRAVEVLPARFVFVLVGVLIALSWCGVNAQTDRQTDRSGRHRPGLGLGEGLGGALDLSSAEKVRAQA